MLEFCIKTYDHRSGIWDEPGGVGAGEVNQY